MQLVKEFRPEWTIENMRAILFQQSWQDTSEQLQEFPTSDWFILAYAINEIHFPNDNRCDLSSCTKRLSSHLVGKAEMVMTNSIDLVDLHHAYKLASNHPKDERFPGIGDPKVASRIFEFVQQHWKILAPILNNKKIPVSLVNEIKQSFAKKSENSVSNASLFANNNLNNNTLADNNNNPSFKFD